MHTIKEIHKMKNKTFHKKEDKSAGPWQSSKSEKYSRVELACVLSVLISQVTSGSEYMKHVSELNTEKIQIKQISTVFLIH